MAFRLKRARDNRGDSASTRTRTAREVAAWVPIYLGNATLLARLEDGQHIYLDADDISLTPHIARLGYWEAWVTRAFRSVLKPGQSVVDIGCNCGYFTLLACKAVGPGGRVTAIDANPRMADLVGRSIAVNGHGGFAKAVHAAVMEDEAQVEFAIPSRYKGSATYMRPGVDFSREGDSQTVIEVAGAPLHKLVSGKVDVLKIDAEGAEPLILRGSRDFIEQNGACQVFMEFAPPMFQHILSGDAFLDYIEDLGFSILEIDHAGEVAPVDRSSLLTKPTSDLLLRREG